MWWRGGSTFGYAFIGWSPAVASVTEDETYTAMYRKYLVGGEVGITVSNGTVTEDISVGSLGGYSYFEHETLGGADAAGNIRQRHHHQRRFG